VEIQGYSLLASDTVAVAQSCDAAGPSWGAATAGSLSESGVVYSFQAELGTSNATFSLCWSRRGAYEFGQLRVRDLELRVVTGEWGACSVSCGGGQRQRLVSCAGADGENHDLDKCSRAGLDVPVATEVCEELPCVQFEFQVGNWSDCSVSCGGGQQARSVVCSGDDGNVYTDEDCVLFGLPAVAAARECNTQRCTEYTAGDWSDCSTTCGAGTRVRNVGCSSDGGVVPIAECTGSAPAASEVCSLRPCSLGTFAAKSWGSCSVSCGSGVRVRELVCTDDSAAVYPLDTCGGTRPATQEQCGEVECAAVGAVEVQVVRSSLYLPPEVPIPEETYPSFAKAIAKTLEVDTDQVVVVGVDLIPSDARRLSWTGRRLASFRQRIDFEVTVEEEPSAADEGSVAPKKAVAVASQLDVFSGETFTQNLKQSLEDDNQSEVLATIPETLTVDVTAAVIETRLVTAAPPAVQSSAPSAASGGPPIAAIAGGGVAAVALAAAAAWMLWGKRRKAGTGAQETAARTVGRLLSDPNTRASRAAAAGARTTATTRTATATAPAAQPAAAAAPPAAPTAVGNAGPAGVATTGTGTGTGDTNQQAPGEGGVTPEHDLTARSFGSEEQPRFRQPLPQPVRLTPPEPSPAGSKDPSPQASMRSVDVAFGKRQLSGGARGTPRGALSGSRVWPDPAPINAERSEEFVFQEPDTHTS